MILTNAGDVKITQSNGFSDTIEVLYGQDMSESARNLSNYQLDGKALPAGSTVDFVDGKDKVKIVLPEGSLKSTTSYMFTIKTDVTTKEGSIIVGSTQTKKPAEVLIELADTVAPTMVSAVYLRSDEDIKPGSKSNILEVTMSEDVKLNGASSTDAKLLDDIKVTVAGSNIAIDDISVDPSNSKRLLVTLNEYVNISQSAKIVAVAEEDQKETSKTTHITDIEGNKLKAGSNTTATNSKFSTSVTPANTISSVGVKTAPTKVAYLNGENLNLTGLVVTLTKADGTTEDVAFADFASKGLTAKTNNNVANGAALSSSDINVVITHTDSGEVANQSIIVAATVNPTFSGVLQLGETTTGSLTNGGLATTKEYTSQDTSIVTVNNVGAINALAAGTTTIDYVGKDANGVVIEKGTVTITVAS